jgi:hypothetical protein
MEKFGGLFYADIFDGLGSGQSLSAVNSTNETVKTLLYQTE